MTSQLIGIYNYHKDNKLMVNCTGTDDYEGEVFAYFEEKDIQHALVLLGLTMEDISDDLFVGIWRLRVLAQRTRWCCSYRFHADLFDTNPHAIPLDAINDMHQAINALKGIELAKRHGTQNVIQG